MGSGLFAHALNARPITKHKSHHDLNAIILK